MADCHAQARYVPRSPQDSDALALVREHWPAFRERLEERAGSLPGFVRDELEAFITCGDFEHGFLVAQCRRCGDSLRVPFACKSRGICPLQDATERAAALDPEAVLVSVAAFGLRSDGTVDLVGDTGFVRRWVFGFQRTDGTDFRYDFTPDNGGSEDFPLLEDPTGSIVAELAFNMEPIDSDVIASTFEDMCGLTLADNELDGMTITFNDDHQTLAYTVALGTGEGWLMLQEGDTLVPIAEGVDPCF